MLFFYRNFISLDQVSQDLIGNSVEAGAVPPL